MVLSGAYSPVDPVHRQLLTIKKIWKYCTIFRTQVKICLVYYGTLNVLRAFKRYNTSLPSSAPVERFSFSGMIHNLKRTRLSGAKFEQLVLLKANGKRNEF